MECEFRAIVIFKILPELGIAWDGIGADVNLKLRGKRTTECSKQNQGQERQQDSAIHYLCFRNLEYVLSL